MYLRTQSLPLPPTPVRCVRVATPTKTLKDRFDDEVHDAVVPVLLNLTQWHVVHGLAWI